MHNNTKINTGRKAAFGGIATSLSLICLYISGAGLLPFNRLSLFALSTMFVFVMVIEFGVSSAFITFGATSLLALIIVPNKIILIPYVLFFGYYGILKYSIERMDKVLLEWVLKIVSFNIAAYIAYLIIVRVVMQQFALPYQMGMILLALQIIFIIYDLAYSIVIGYYQNSLRKILKRG